MSAKTVANKIQDVVAGTTLIRSAPHIESWPPIINDADLPMALTRPGPATWPHDSIADVRSHRTYVTDIYVKPNSEGVYAEGIDATLAIIEAVGLLLSADFQLAGSSSAVAFDSEPRDRGLVVLSYGGADYRGTVFELDVIEDVAG